jgi:hypothetical protein
MTRKAVPVARPYQTDRRHWHFEKRLSIDTLVGIVGVALVVGGPVLFWGRVMENRVLTLENINVERDKATVKEAVDSRDQRSLVGSRLDKIDDKMNQLQVDVAKLVVQGQRPLR